MEYGVVLEQELISKEKHQLKSYTNLPEGNVLLFNDENKVRQVLNNLIQNAIKFTDLGSITLGATLKKEQVTIYVADTGIGIEEDQQQYIFERFRQVEDSLDRSAGGTGLGLYISSTLVKHLGGQIWTESKPGKGSTFYFTLPVPGSDEQK
jgi:signal transduction histidine kinase